MSQAVRLLRWALGLGLAVAAPGGASSFQETTTKLKIATSDAKGARQADEDGIAQENRRRVGSSISILDFIPAPLHAGIRVGTNTVDLSPYFADAIAKLNTGSTYTGGTLDIPAGLYKLDSAWNIATTNADGVASLNLRGANKHDTVLDFSGARPPTTDCLLLNKVNGVSIHDLKVLNCATGANIAQSGSHDIDYANIRTQGARTDGLKIDNSFTTHVRDVLSMINGGNGFNLGSTAFNTSMNFNGGYAYRNKGSGLFVNNTVYSTFIGVASDQNATGYTVQNVRGVSFIGCGAEENVLQGFVVAASAASGAPAAVLQKGVEGLTIQNCFGFRNYTRNLADPTASNFGLWQSDGAYPLHLVLIGNTDAGLQTNVKRSNHFSGPQVVTEIDNTFSGQNGAFDGQQTLTVIEDGTVTASAYQTKPYTVVTLPPCTDATKGRFTSVTDASAPAYNATLRGGGNATVPAFCNGSAWVAH